MAHKTEIEVEIKNAESVDSFFDRLKRSFGEWKKQGKEALSEMAKGTSESLTSGLGGIVSSLGADLINTLLQPLSFSFSKAVASAKEYRAAVTDAALSTGKTFDQASDSIEQTSYAILESHQTVLSFSGAVQKSTGYWLEGTNAMEAYQDRAKFLGRSFGDMAKEASTLSQLFDLRDGDKISTLFQTMNAQADQLGVNAKAAAIQFDQLASSMARLTSASPEKISAISSAFLKAAGGNQAQASVIQQGFMNFIKPRISYIEDEMRATGQIKKSESILGKDGRIREELLIPIVKMEQEYIKKHFGREPWREQMRILGQGNVFGSSEAAAGFLNLDTAAMEAASKRKEAPNRPYLQKEIQSADGDRKLSNLVSEYQEMGVGAPVLTWQDKIVKAKNSAGEWFIDHFIGRFLYEKYFGETHQKKFARVKANQINSNQSGNQSSSQIFSHNLNFTPASRSQSDLLSPPVDDFPWTPQTPIKDKKNSSVLAQPQRLSSKPPPSSKAHQSRPIFHWSGADKEPVLSKENQEKIRKLLPEDIKELAKQFGDNLLSRTLKVQVIPDAPPEPIKPPQGERNHG